MAVRKAYLPLAEFPYVKEISIAFRWFSGSKHRNIQAVQEAFRGMHPELALLEVSPASPQPEGAAAAAMKLPLQVASLGQEVPVGIVYEASKAFEAGGPYTELLQWPRQKVQKDARLQQSGKCTGYQLEGTAFPAEPYPYAFFNWLYGCALQQNPERAENVLKFSAFTDLELGSAKKDKNSPARAAAVYAGLAAAGRLDCLKDYASFVAETCMEPGAEHKAPEAAPEAEQTVLELPVPEPVREAAPADEPAPSEEPVENAAAEEPVAELPAEDPTEQTVQEPEMGPAEEPVAEQAAEPAEPPAEETVPEAPAAPQPTGEANAIPTAEQIEAIGQAPKAKNLMISLAKNAGCSATSAAGIVKAGRSLLRTSYQNALQDGTLTINPEKNKIIFPLENPETGFHTVGQLTRSPSFVQGWKFNYQPCETAVTPEKPAAAPVQACPTAEDYLVSHGYTITQRVRAEDLPPLAVQKLAWETGEALRDPAVAAFLQFIRTHLQFHDSFTFRLPKEAATESKELVVALAQSWDHLGLFAEFNANTTRVICTLAENEVVRHFVSGHWLELYVVHCVQQLLERLHEERDVPVSLCSNVVLSSPPKENSAQELDVVFSVNGVFFWIEAKSSSRNIDYGKYAGICKKLQVSPEQLLLVNSDLSEEDCQGVSYFWPYRIANCATMARELEEMIEKQLAGAEEPEEKGSV